MDFIIEFVRFLKFRKRYWLVPIFISLLGLALLIVFAKGSMISPFIYTLF